MLKDIQHLDFGQLVDLAEGRTPENQRAALSSHLELCSKCNDRSHEVDQLLALMKTDHAVDPPRDVVSMAFGLFAQRPERPSLVKRLIARLSFDSLTETPAFGVRSEASTSRQLLYSIDDSEIDLRVTQHDGRWILAGQLLGQDDCTSGSVELVGSGVRELSVLNDLCEFKFPSVPEGEYKLTLKLNDLEVEVPRLELRA